jgi:hypothetical protein
MNDPQLMTRLRFNESELLLNQNGKLSEKQKERLQIKESGAKAGALFLGLIFVGAALLGFGIAAVTAFNSDDFVFKAIFGSVFGCIWPLIWGTAGFFTLKRAFTKVETRVKKVEGVVNIIKVIRKNYDSNTQTYSDYSAYELRIGGRTFDVRPELANFMMQGDMYAVYYADFNLKDKQKEILSAEFVAKGGTHTEAKSLSMDDIEVVEYLKKGDVLRAIRAHRSIHGSDFEDAKAAVEDVQSRLITQPFQK